jgi:protein phosphatase PTC6
MDGGTCKHTMVCLATCMSGSVSQKHFSLGDLRYKKFGITAEPEVRTKVLEGSIYRRFQFQFKSFLGADWAFLVLVSDGISAILSDDEIVDLVRDANDPKTAAEKILAFSEELGGNDNATAIVIPLAGWNKIDGPDKTRELRDYRRLQAGMISRFLFTHSILTEEI